MSEVLKFFIGGFYNRKVFYNNLYINNVKIGILRFNRYIWEFLIFYILYNLSGKKLGIVYINYFLMLEFNSGG